MVYEGNNCPQISIYTIEGPLFFGVASMFTKTMKLINYKPKILLLCMSHVPFIDTTGESNLKDTVNNFTSDNGIVLISGIKEHPKEVLKKSGLYNLIGKENFFDDTEQAIKYAVTLIDQEKCDECKYYAFKECKKFNIENTVNEAEEAKKII